MPLFSRSDSGASFFSTLSHLRQKMGRGDFSPTAAKSSSPKARIKGDDLPFSLITTSEDIYIHIKIRPFLMLIFSLSLSLSSQLSLSQLSLHK